MRAKLVAPARLSGAVRLKPALWIIALLAFAAAGLWVRNTWASSIGAVTTKSTSGSAITPALQLAVGTMNLEGTQNAVDAASAANLLPLWQLLEELDNNASSAPQEITAVVEEIRSNMTASQIQAIEAMSVQTSQIAAISGTSSSASGTKASSQSASAGAMPMMGADLGGGPPMGGGGPMPSSNASQSSSTSKASTALIQEVIQLLEKKVQS